MISNSSSSNNYGHTHQIIILNIFTTFSFPSFEVVDTLTLDGAHPVYPDDFS